ncbi:hypothetical protein ABVT39_025215 [Epinephelus coioides]
MEKTNLEWQRFNGSLPDGAVSIYNDYVGRTDYVAKCGWSAGFYNPDKGPYCYYAYGDKEHQGSPFEILVNKDNFEFLEWKDGDHGSVPQNSVSIGPGMEIYVGKNKYGLGKVDVKNTAFFLPWEGSEHWYKNYEVLTLNKEVIRERIFEVKYKTDDINIIKNPPETLDKSVITNHDRNPVTGTAKLEKKTIKEQRWDTSFSFTMGVTTSITAGVPEVCSVGVEVSMETTQEYSQGSSITQDTTHSLAVEYTVPPEHTCTVRMVGYKYIADIPFTARVERTYRNGTTRFTTITGTYKGVQIGDIRAVVDRAEPLPKP